MSKKIKSKLKSRVYRRHERVEHADSERSSASEWLSEVELRIRIVVVILVQKLHVAIIHQFWLVNVNNPKNIFF